MQGRGPNLFTRLFPSLTALVQPIKFTTINDNFKHVLTLMQNEFNDWKRFMTSYICGEGLTERSGDVLEQT